MKLAKDTSPEQFRRMEESFRLALPDIEAALRINARLIYAYLLLMRINRSTGDQERGAVLVQKALEVAPDSYLVRAYHMLLLSPRWGGSYEAMQEFAADSLLHAAKNPLFKTLLGMVWADQADTERRQDPQKAVALGEKALTYGETWDSLYSLAWAYYRAQIYDKALATVERAVALYSSLPDRGLLFTPNPATAQGLRSRILFRQEKWDAALEALQIMQQSGEMDAGDADEIRRWEGSQLLRQGHAVLKTDLGRAIELYTLTLRFDPDNAKAYCWRGIAYNRLGKPELAFNALQQAIAINPHLYEAYKGLDDLLLKQGRLDEIIAAWNRLLQLEPDNAKAHVERGGTYYRKRDLAAALQDAKRACELGHEDACRLVQRLQK